MANKVATKVFSRLGFHCFQFSSKGVVWGCFTDRKPDLLEIGATLLAGASWELFAESLKFTEKAGLANLADLAGFPRRT